jgi:cytochrome c-type biogenesis protein CcmE
MRGKKLKFAIGGAVIVLAVVALVFFAARGTAVYYYTVGEIQAKGASTNVRVAGMLVNGTIVQGSMADSLTFQIRDKGAVDRILKVDFKGARPDTFKDEPNTEVVVEGDFVAPDRFEARSMLAKCPSKYEKALDDTSGPVQSGQTTTTAN